MAVAMISTATAQLMVGVIVQLYGHFAWVFTLVFAGAWLCSGWLFRKATKGSAPMPSTHKDTKATVSNGEVTEWRCTLKITFVLND